VSTSALGQKRTSIGSEGYARFRVKSRHCLDPALMSAISHRRTIRKPATYVVTPIESAILCVSNGARDLAIHASRIEPVIRAITMAPIASGPLRYKTEISMNDYQAIQETLNNYFEGYVSKDRAKLEKAFALEVANMIGYSSANSGKLELFSIPMTDLVEKWTSSDYIPFEFGERKILSLHVFSDDGAVAVFDCGGLFLDTFQMVKLNGQWKIANKFFVDQNDAGSVSADA